MSTIEGKRRPQCPKQFRSGTVLTNDVLTPSASPESVTSFLKHEGRGEIRLGNFAIHRHEQSQIVKNGTRSWIFCCVPPPVTKIIQEGLLLTMGLHLEFSSWIKLQVLTLQAMQDTVHLRIRLLQGTRDRGTRETIQNAMHFLKPSAKASAG